MAACPYKSAEELGLSQEQWEALIKTQKALENDQIRHVHVQDDDWDDDANYDDLPKKEKLPVGFNMNLWREIGAVGGKCGSVCCIGGTAELLSGFKVSLTSGDIPDELEGLFYPNFNKNWDSLTPQQAAKALDHYLKTGDHGYDCWRLALGKKKA